MARTRGAPLPRGEDHVAATLVFAAVVGGAGMLLLYRVRQSADDVADLCHLRRLRGHLYGLLKPVTPQNIVIGGASGAMPPVLGWAAVTNDVRARGLLLFLIIFVWTPPHFWALALYRAKDYARAGLPMLPVTHGPRFTRGCKSLLYTILFAGVQRAALRASGMSGWLYLVAALILGGYSCLYASACNVHYSDALARRTFRFPSSTCRLLFAALLVDHYLQFP